MKSIEKPENGMQNELFPKQVAGCQVDFVDNMAGYRLS